MRYSNEFLESKGIGDIAIKLVEIKKDIIYQLVYLLLKLAFILPVVTATVERAFSTMIYVNNMFYSRMGDQWMNDRLTHLLKMM